MQQGTGLKYRAAGRIWRMADELWENRRWEAKNAWRHFRNPIDSVKDAAHGPNASSFTFSEAGWQRTRTSMWFCSVLIQTSEEWEWVFGNVQKAARTPARREDDAGRYTTAAWAQNHRSLNLYLLGKKKHFFIVDIWRQTPFSSSQLLANALLW